jgi:hypothetical protein
MTLNGLRVALAVLSLAVPAVRAEDVESDDEFGMTKPVVCSSVLGYGEYTIQPDAAIYRDNKLLIYYEPFGYTIRKTGASYRALLTQDVRIRRRGQKTVLMKKDGILRYEAKSETPPLRLYLSNFLSTKGLSPGEYDLEIILHDKFGKSPAVTKIVPFQIKQLKPAEPEADGTPATSAPAATGQSKDEPDAPTQSTARGNGQ